MSASTTTTRRIVVAIVLVAALPFMVGFLSGFSYFVTGEPVTPSWVHTARVLLSWLTVVAVYAWFVAGNDVALVKRVAMVLIGSWILSECLAAVSGLVLSYATDFDGPIWAFQLGEAGTAILRALAGVFAGLTLRLANTRRVADASSGAGPAN